MSRIKISRVIAVVAALLTGNALWSQNTFEVSAGAGLFEGGFLKAKYGNRFEIGVSQDLVSQLHTTGLEVYFRIPRKYEPAYDTFEQVFIYPRIGRSFLFRSKTGRAGLNADIGFAIHRHTNPPEGYIMEVFPISCSAGLFYRF